MLQSLRWAALGTGFTFGMTTLGAALVFFWRESRIPAFSGHCWGLPRES